MFELVAIAINKSLTWFLPIFALALACLTSREIDAQENALLEVDASPSDSRSITLVNGTLDEVERLVFPADIRRVYLRNCDMNDASLKRLEGLKYLQYLSIEGASINGEGLSVVKSLPALKSLSLNGTKVTDESLKHLREAKKLTILLLRDTNISDEGISSIALLTRLEWLYLDRTKVTDASMRKLGNLRNLKFLSILGTSVTAFGETDLHELVPSVRVRR